MPACVAGVSVGREAVGVNAAAVSVNCETTVLAAEVRTAAISGVGPCPSDAGDGLQAATNKAMKITVITGFSFIEPPSFSSVYFFTSKTMVRGVPKKAPESLLIRQVP